MSRKENHERCGCFAWRTEPTDAKREKVLWQIGEFWIGEERNVLDTVGNEDDGLDWRGECVEIKIVQKKHSDGRHGRLILRRSQHEKACTQDMDYILGLYDDCDWIDYGIRVIDHARVPAVVLHDVMDIHERSWVERKNHEEMGIHWTVVPWLTSGRTRVQDGKRESR